MIKDQRDSAHENGIKEASKLKPVTTEVGCFKTSTMALRYAFLLFAVVLTLASGFRLENPDHAYPKAELLVPQEPRDIKIVAGQDATQGQFPYQIQMFLVILGSRNFRCGGSLIAENFVLSAAHCVDGYENQASNFRLVAGELIVNQNSGLEQEQTVSRIFKHENYNSQTVEDDIALLQTVGRFTLNANVGTICIPPAGFNPTGEGIASGWGKTSGTGNVANHLQYTPLTIITDSACQNLYGSVSVRDNDICAGDGPQGQTVCNGDSGGPFAVGNRVVGITSRVGTGCVHATIFTETSYYVAWIQANSGVGTC